MLDVRAWLRDRAVRRVAKYGVPIALGKLFTSLSGLITLAVMARYVGKAGYGLIAEFRSVVVIVDMYANFNTWQAIVKFGTQAVADGRPGELRRIIKFTFLIDAVTAVLGFAVVVGLAFVVPGRFGWSGDDSLLCALYGVTLISRVAGTSDGIFRICDAYRAQAIAASLGAVAMTAIAIAFVACGASFAGCVLALVLGEVASNLGTTIAAFWVAHQHGYGGWWRAEVKGVRREHPGILRFLISTNAQLTVRTTQSELDMVVVGATLGKESAGLFRVIKQLGTIPGKVFMPFEQVLFTELARAAANRDYRGFRSLLRRTVALFGGGSLAIWAVVALGARYVVIGVAGADFVAATDPLRWYLLAMVLHIAAAPVMRAMIALGRPGTLFWFDSASLVMLIGAVIAGATLYGLTGVAIAIIAHKSIQLLWSTTWVMRHLAALERARAGADQLPISTTNTDVNAAGDDAV